MGFDFIVVVYMCKFLKLIFSGSEMFKMLLFIEIYNSCERS